MPILFRALKLALIVAENAVGISAGSEFYCTVCPCPIGKISATLCAASIKALLSNVYTTGYLAYWSGVVCHFNHCGAINERNLLIFEHIALHFFLLLYVPSQQLWSLRDGQFT